MNRFKRFFKTIWQYITSPYYRLTTRKIDKELTRLAEEYRRASLTEKDVEFLRKIGVDTDLETLQTGGKSAENNKTS